MYYQVIINDNNKQAKAALGLLRTIEGVSILALKNSTTRENTELQQTVEALKDGLKEVADIKKGRKKPKSLQDLLNES